LVIDIEEVDCDVWSGFKSWTGFFCLEIVNNIVVDKYQQGNS